MEDVITSVLGLLLLALLFGFVVSMVKPSWPLNDRLFKNHKRSNLAAKYGIAFLVVFIALGIITPPQTKQNEEASKALHKSQTLITNAQVKSAETEQNLGELYDVVKVVDGDTVDVRMNGKTERLRLIGMDTPETVDPRKPVECFGMQASAEAHKLLDKQKVYLKADPTQSNRDKYNRLLRYIFMADGTLYNKTMIENGYAHEYTYEIPYQYQKEFKAAEVSARDNNRGLWSPNTCNGDTGVDSGSTSNQTSHKTTSQPDTTSSQKPSSTSCSPNYTPCVPNVSYDLDCSDISFSVRVIGTDVYRFDRDGDGYGCESN